MENTTWVEMTRNFKEYKKGEKYLLDDASANELIDAGLAAKSTDPANDIYVKFENTLKAREQSIVDKINEAVSHPVDVKLPAVARDEKLSVGEFAVALGKTVSRNTSAEDKEKAHNLLNNKYGKKSNLNQGTSTAGGYLVPQYWLEELIYQSGYEGAAFPDRVTIFPMESNILHLPTLDQTVTPSGGSSAMYGGVSVAIVAEGTAPSQNTQPAFKSTQLTAKKILATCQVTRELLDNSPISVEPMIQMLFGDATKAEINYQIVNATGGGSALLGVLNNSATISLNRTTANEITYADVCNMYSHLTPAHLNSAKWFVNPLALSQLFQMTDKSGRAVFLQGFQSAYDKPRNSIFGLEVVVTEAMPTLGSTGDIMLFSPQAYFVGVNKQLTIDASEHYAFTSDIITYRMTMRLDGAPALTAPIYLMDGISQVSPFVQLSSTVIS